MQSFSKPVYVTRPLLPNLEELNKSLKDIWQNQWLTNHGPFHNKLEDELSNVLSIDNISVVNNGTIALLIALRALGITEGEVITTPFTFAATPHSISWNGLKPVFCDIQEDTFCIDASKIEQLITPSTKAILAVHVFGFPCDVEAIQAIANKYNLHVIYDAAHAFQTQYKGKAISQFGDISAFSFHATKLFHSIEGGCLAYNNKDLKEKIYLLRNFGIQDEDNVVDIGLNGKLNEVQAAVGLEVLTLIEEEQKKRAIIYETYTRHLQDIDGIIIPTMPETATNSYQYFPIRVIEQSAGISRNTLYSELKKYNVLSRKYFSPLCSEYLDYKDLPSSKPEHLSVANIINQEILCLPFYGELDTTEIKKICMIIQHIIQSNT